MIKIKEQTRLNWIKEDPHRFSGVLSISQSCEKIMTQENISKVFEIHGKISSVYIEACLLLNQIGYRGEILLPDIIDIKLLLKEYNMLTLEFKELMPYHKPVNIPGCTCPVIDNQELEETGRRIVSGSCIWHNINRPLTQI